jgi:hypothetical protein
VRPGGRLALVDIFVPDGCDPAVANAIERARDASHCSTLLREELLALCEAAGFRVSSSETAARPRSFNDWMHIAGWRPGDPAYIATRRLMEADVSADRSGFRPHRATAFAADFEFMQPSLFVVAEK